MDDTLDYYWFTYLILIARVVTEKQALTIAYLSLFAGLVVIMVKETARFVK